MSMTGNLDFFRKYSFNQVIVSNSQRISALKSSLNHKLSQPKWHIVPPPPPPKKKTKNNNKKTTTTKNKKQQTE